MINRFTGFFLFLILSTLLTAQETYYFTGPRQNYNKGMELYTQHKYVVAQDYFNKVAEYADVKDTWMAMQAKYYEALCALRLFNGDAEKLVIDFMRSYPGSNLANQAYFELANYFYSSKIFDKAIQYYLWVDKNKLETSEHAEYFFKIGYCHFMQEDYDKAREVFYEIKDSKSKYASPAMYYYSHILYDQEKFQSALEGFISLIDDNTFSPIVPYYITQIYFQQRKYNKVVEYAPKFIENVTEKRLAEVARIIGESYLKLERYKESVPYFQTYIENVKEITPEDKYLVAHAMYLAEEYTKAADLYEEVSTSFSVLGQNALFYLADCYLHSGEKQNARMAFASASRLEFDKKIQEDALYNYAVVTYELAFSPFNEAINAFNDYLEKYPNTQRADQANNYLVHAYLSAKNYRLALESIERIQNKTEEIQKAYQKIAYNRGLELLTNLQYTAAIQMLIQSLEYGHLDFSLKALAHYWIAEAQYRLKDYTSALASYNTFIASKGAVILSEFNLAHYGMGYCYFSIEDYARASTWFRKYIGMEPNQFAKTVGDACNRIGDCFFIDRDYYSAIDFYSRAVEARSSSVDYALLQKGISLGVITKYEDKIAILEQLLLEYPGSEYSDDALFEIGESYVSMQQSEKAISYFNQIVNSYTNSSYISKSLVNLGLIYYNAGNNKESLKFYKAVIADYPNSPEAKNALVGIRNIYMETDQLDNYFDYTEESGIVTEISISEKDSLSYFAAERLYMDGNCNGAIQRLESYISNFSNGAFLVNAHFYMGDCYYQQKSFDKARNAFNYVIHQPQNIFTEQSLLGAARINFETKNYEASYTQYEELEKVTERKNNKLEALVGQVRSAYILKQYKKVIEKARALQQMDNISESLNREATFKLAKSYLVLNKIDLALDYFQKVAIEVNSIEGAESKYRVAVIYYQKGNLTEAEKIVYNFSQQTSPHEFWMGKSFLLWADIFTKRGEDFQALQTLESLIEYYGNASDGIIDEARKKKEEITNMKELTKDLAKPDMEINME